MLHMKSSSLFTTNRNRTNRLKKSVLLVASVKSLKHVFEQTGTIGRTHMAQAQKTGGRRTGLRSPTSRRFPELFGLPIELSGNQRSPQYSIRAAFHMGTWVRLGSMTCAACCGRTAWQDGCGLASLLNDPQEDPHRSPPNGPCVIRIIVVGGQAYATSYSYATKSHPVL